MKVVFEDSAVESPNSVMGYTVTKSEPNEASLWKITFQKRGNSHVDTGTFIPSLTRFLYILLCGKSVPVHEREHFTGLRKGNFLELTFLTDISGKFPHSVFLKDISGKFPHSRGKNVLGALPLPGSFLKSLPYKTKDLAILN
jgi:hypothetical protein